MGGNSSDKKPLMFYLGFLTSLWLYEILHREPSCCSFRTIPVAMHPTVQKRYVTVAMGHHGQEVNGVEMNVGLEKMPQSIPTLHTQCQGQGMEVHGPS